MTDPKTQVMMIPGAGCALCRNGQGSPGIHVPVFGPGGQPLMPRVCQHCLSALLGVALQLAGHAHEQVAAAVVSLSAAGRPPAS